MDRLELIAEIKRRVGKAEIEDALQRLVDDLEQSGSKFANDAIQVQSLFRKTQKDEKQGLVSFDNAKLSYNQVTDQILDLLETIKEEELRAQSAQTVRSKVLWPWIAGGVLVLAIIVALIFSNQNNTPVVVADASCPDFNNYSDTTAFNILLIPFLPLAEGSESLESDIPILDNLTSFIEKYGINAAIRRYKINPKAELDRYESIITNKKKLAEDCRVKLLIWGTKELESSGVKKFIANYKFFSAGNGEHFAFAKLNVLEGSNMATVNAVSNISTEGVLISENLQNSIKILFGIIANEKGNTEAAIAQLENIEPSDSLTSLLWGMTLADSQIKSGQPEKALESLNKVLETHKDYGFALNNRAALNYQMGNLDLALQDYNTQIELKKGNDSTSLAGRTEALIGRAAVYLKAESLDKAQEDIESAEKIKPQDPRIQQVKKEVKSQIKLTTDLKDRAVAKLQMNPDDFSALMEKATYEKALGNYVDAASTAEKVLNHVPGSAKAYAIIIEAKKELNDSGAVRKWTKKAMQNSVKYTEIVRNAPLMESVRSKSSN